MPSAASDFVEEVAFELPPGVVPHGVTADGHVFAGWPQDDGRVRFLWDGVAGEPFDQFVPMRDGTFFFWSADNCHVAYMGARAGSGFVGRDGAEGPPFEDISRSVPPMFSTDGGHLAHGATVGGQYRLIVDGAVAGTEALAPIAAVFSPDGNRFAFVEARGSMAKDGEQRIVVDGTAGTWFRGMRNAPNVLQFSPDGRRFAYYRIDGKGGAQWVVDGREHRWIDDTRPLTMARIRGVGVLDPPLMAGFSPDSRRFAYFADIKEKGVAVVEDDVVGPPVHGLGEMVFSDDSQRLAYTAMDLAKNWVVVVDGVVGTANKVEGLGAPVFSPDGRRIAWTMQRQEGSFLRKQGMCALLVDDNLVIERPGNDMSLRPQFSPDGTRIAWWIQHGPEGAVYVDAESGPTLSGVSDPTFTPSGHLLYGGLASGQATMYVDHRPGPLASNFRNQPGELGPSHVVPFRVSADGDHVAWAGIYPDGERPVLDDRVGPLYDVVLAWSFAPDGLATWWTQRGQNMFRVRAQG